MHLLAVAIALLLTPHPETELEACRRLAPKYGAEAEVLMPDGTRCDLLSDQYAIEVDWAEKHHEAVSQAVLYSIWTGRKPAVLLLVTDDSCQTKLYLLRCKLVCERLGIRLFIERSRGQSGCPKAESRKPKAESEGSEAGPLSAFGFPLSALQPALTRASAVASLDDRRLLLLSDHGAR